MLLLCLFVAAEEFVALNGRYDSDGAFVARLGSLYSAKAADAHGTCQGNFVRQGQKNFDRRPLAHILGKEEVNSARTDVARFGACFANRGSRSPADGKRQPHLKALRRAAFGTGQGRPPD